MKSTDRTTFKFTDNLKYWLLLGTCKIVGALPAWLLYYVILDVLCFLLYRVARYRRKTVRGNLEHAFPEKSVRERRKIERGFYTHLAGLFIDTLDIAGIGRREMRKRMVFRDLARHEEEVASTGFIAALAHYGSWEYFTAYQLHTPQQVAAAYRPLHSKTFDRFYRYSRSRMGVEPVASKNVLRYMVGAARTTARDVERDPAYRKVALGLISDQNVRSVEHHIWFDFMGHRTLFFSGIEKIAVRFGLPVYYMDVTKLSRTRSEARFVRIYDGREQLAEEGVITERYVRRLEATIRREPRYWLWSHRKWKHKFRERPGDKVMARSELPDAV